MIGDLYKCYYTVSSPGGYKKHGTYRIVTTGLVKAAQLCEEAVPDAAVFNVIHSGRVEFIDPELLKTLLSTTDGI